MKDIRGKSSSVMVRALQWIMFRILTKSKDQNDLIKHTVYKEHEPMFKRELPGGREPILTPAFTAWVKNQSASLQKPASGSYTELPEFWGALEEGNIHPDDRRYITPVDFATSLAPQPWIGPITTSDIFVLMLNPGLSGEESDYEAARPDFRRALRENLKGDKANLFLDPRFADHPGSTWTRRIFGRDLSLKLSERLCMVELVPYHSRQGQVATTAAKVLPSSKLAMQWVHRTLKPMAEQGQIVMIIPRAVRAWGFEPGIRRGSLLTYDTARARGAFMTSNTTGGQLIAEHIRSHPARVSA